MEQGSGAQAKITTLSLVSRKKKGQTAEPLVAITAYDYSFAKLVDEYADIVLVGDSLGMVIQGQPHTLSVTLDEMIYHGRAVARGLKHALLVVDMPFMTFQLNADEALRNAGRLVAEGGAEAVKLEGGVRIQEAVKKIVDAGIPVVGHIGLTPQSVHTLGGYRIQGRTEAARAQLLEDALALEKAGAFCLVLEGVPSTLAQEITQRLQIPTVGIGAGIHCDGQILVMHDVLGLNVDFKPRFVKRFAEMASLTREAVGQFRDEVRSRTFPKEEHSY